MNHLVNNELRTKNMVELLSAMGIHLENTELVCKDELIILSPENLKEAQELTAKLQKIIQKNDVVPTVRQIKFEDLLTEEIEKATYSGNFGEMNKKICLTILDNLQETVQDQQQEFNIQLDPIYTPIFKSLNYKYLTVDNDKIKFNMQEFLKAHPQELVLIDKKSPSLIIPSELFENKKVFYAEKSVDEDTIEVTPYFFVPNTLIPPVYHFVLDTSESMNNERLNLVKKSVIELADALFQFQPNAGIHITEFNTTTTKLGHYQKENFAELTQNINSLKASGATRLFGAIHDQLSLLLESTQHNNVLLFTDGKNNQGYQQELENLMSSLQENSLLITARNKFFILSYGTKQPEVLHKMTELFSSSVLKTNTADFIVALSEKNRLQEWAAARELFTCSLEIIENSDLNVESKQYVNSYNLSGQFVPFAPLLLSCKNESTLHVTVTDSDGNKLLDDTKIYTKKPNEASLFSSTVATFFSMFTTQTTTNVENVETSTARFN
ncbi:VWA domain-containing protein [Legionella sp.]|uniref:VWA domain-containing protein n=1 Tax=Legionella sp. TaxID=459 RepID=UPI003CA47419